ncbi:MAG: fumarylacetoacetate hydrolase family protein [Proteobacteria bacterium]|nr:fumarylacetoacetate hydrolase family protein [Pseudomonadota bacterium]
MRFCSFRFDGAARFGVVDCDGIVDLTGRVAYPDLAAAIVANDLGSLERAASGVGVDIALSDVIFLPTIPAPSKVVCIGLNYEPHRIEMGRDKDPYPTVFVRLNDTLVGHGCPLTKPRNSDAFDFEGEIALVIGKAGRHIAEADAMDHVVGYTCFMDASVRDFQSQNLIAGKNFPATGGMGPWLVPAGAMPAVHEIALETRLNGARMQEGRLDELTYSIPEIIAYISSWTDLRPGDVISTGTPSGVGTARKPPVYMKPGDLIEVSVTGIGVLRHAVVAEA